MLLKTKTQFSALSCHLNVFSENKWSTIEITLPFITVIYKIKHMINEKEVLKDQDGRPEKIFRENEEEPYVKSRKINIIYQTREKFMRERGKKPQKNWPRFKVAETLGRGRREEERKRGRLRVPKEVVKPDKDQQLFGQYSWAHGEILGVSCARPGVGLNDPERSLPNQYTL